jgi:hypothetical protein
MIVPIVFSLCVFATAATAQDLADFGIPAASDNPASERAVKDPGSVTTTENEVLDQPVISASSTQDAVNAAQQELVDDGDEARFISTGSGMGVVAVGWGSYSFDNANNNLNLLQQRGAFLEATLEARANLAAFLGGLELEGKQELVKQFDMIDGGDESLANSSSISVESISERISGMLRGVVVYDVQDNAEEGAVMVTVVTTPKTQGAVQSGNGSVQAGSIQAGLQAVFSEIKAGLVPPDGGRVITVPSTGQIAWIGFGSEINRTNRNKSLQRKLKSQAKNTAKMRARRSLLAVINGEDVYKDSELINMMSQDIKQFDRVPGPDGEEVIEKKESDEIKAFAQQVTVDALGSSTVGELPAGVSVKGYESKDGNWSYAVAIYMAEATGVAKGLAASMQKNSPLTAGVKSPSYETNPDGSFKLGPDGKPIPKSMGSGRVTKDGDL